MSRISLPSLLSFFLPPPSPSFPLLTYLPLPPFFPLLPFSSFCLPLSLPLHPLTHLSVAKQYESVEHVEDLEARLVDGEDDSAFGVSEIVQVTQQFK